MKQEIKKIKEQFNLAIDSYFDSERTGECDQYVDLIPELILIDNGNTSKVLKNPQLSRMREHISRCIYCEHQYSTLEELINNEIHLSNNNDEENFKNKMITNSEDDFIPSPEAIAALNYRISVNFSTGLTGNSSGLIPLGEISLTLKDVPNHEFTIRLFFEEDTQTFLCDLKSRNRLEKYQVIYQDNSGSSTVLFDENEGGILQAGKYSATISLNIKKESFKWQNINVEGFNDRIFIIEK